MYQVNVCSASAHHMKLDFTAPCINQKLLPLLLTNPEQNDEIVVANNLQKVLQHVVASKKFYHCSKGRFDSVMMENSDMAEMSLGSTTKLSVSFARRLLFLRFQIAEEVKNTNWTKFSNASSPARMNESVYVELCFVQWYKSMDKKRLEIDIIDEVLNCVGLRCQRPSGKAGQLAVGNEFERV